MLFSEYLILDNELALKNLYNNSEENLWVFKNNVIILLLDDVVVPSLWGHVLICDVISAEVDGGWTEWGEWSELCYADCGKKGRALKRLTKIFSKYVFYNILMI